MGVFKRFISEFTENDDEDLKDYAEEEESEVSASTPAKSTHCSPCSLPLRWWSECG